MSDAARHPRILDLPRDETGLATTATAQRRLQELLPVFLGDLTEKADADGLIVPLDGGVETAVAAALAVDAAGADAVHGLVMPAGLTDEATARTAETVAEMLDVDCRRLQLQPVVAAFQETIGATGQPADDVHAMDNAVARFRTATTYYVANRENALVVGPVDRTDRLLGTATKYGETGADCYLFGDLYRTEIRSLAEAMDLPTGMLADGSHATNYTTPTDAERLDVEPEAVDRVLRLYVDERRDPEDVAERVDVDRTVVTRLADRIAATRHKRHQPPKPSTHV